MIRFLHRTRAVHHARAVHHGARALHHAERPTRTVRLVLHATFSTNPRSNLDWNDLDSVTRNHWITLGWDKESWSDLNYDGFSNPTTESLDWSELNEEQQHSAEMLGYDEAGWNAGEDEEEKKGGEQKERDPDEGFMGFDWKTLWYALGALTLWYGYTTWLDYNEKKKWDKVGLTKDDRVEILNWIKPICDGYTDASWKDKEHETKHQETLDYDGEHVMKMLRTCFLQLAVPIESDDNDDVDPVDSDDNNIKLHRMAITRDSWLKHAGCDENVELKKASLALFHAADIDHDEYVDFNEFAMLLVLLTVGSDTQIDSSALADLLFTMMDHDGNDELSFQEVDDFLELARNAGNRRCDNTFAKDVFAAAAAMDYEVRVADYETVTKEYGWSKTREAAHQELTEEYLSSGFKIEFLSRDLFVRTVGSTIAREMAIGLHFLHVDDYLNPDTGQVIAGDGDPTGHHLNTMPKELHSFSNEFAKLITAGVLARAWQENHGYRHRLTSGVGGGSYRGGGCFAPGTLVLMGDMRSTTKIEELRPGDVTAGGTVKAAMQFDKSLCAPMYKLHGVSVTGDHAVLVVLEEERCFVRVADVSGAILLEVEEEEKEEKEKAVLSDERVAKPLMVHDLITTEHRIHVVTNEAVTVFADYEEVPEGLEEYKILLRGLNGGKI